MNKKTAAFLLTSSILTGAVLAIAPLVTAVIDPDWTALEPDKNYDSLSEMNSHVFYLGNDPDTQATEILIIELNQVNRLQAVKCVFNTDSVDDDCGITNIFAGNDVNTRALSFRAIGGGTVAGCFAEETVNKIWFMRTTDGDVFNLVDTGAGNASNGKLSCQYGSVGQNHYIAYTEGTSNEVFVAKSTNNGLSWTHHWVDSLTGAGGIGIAVFNETSLAVMYDDTTMGVCKTQNSAANFTCHNTGLVANSATVSSWFVNGKIILSGYPSNDFDQIYISDTEGDFWATVNVGFGASRPISAIATSNGTVIVAGGSGVQSQISYQWPGRSDWDTETIDDSDGAAGSRGGMASLDITKDRLYACYVVQTTSAVDEIGCYANDGFGAEPPTPTDDEIGVTDLVGFHVDDNGQTIITREESGATVKTYSGTDLSAKGSFATADCNRIDGVMSEGNVVGFIDCEPVNDPNFFRIRSDGLSAASFESFCFEDDIDLDTGDFGHADTIQELKEVVNFPIDWSFSQGTNAFGQSEHSIAWAFSTFSPTNEIGVATLACEPGLSNKGDEAKINFGGTVTNICSTLQNGIHYIGAAGETTNTKIFRVDFEIDTADEIAVTIQSAPIWEGTGALANANGIACENNRVLISTVGGTVALIDFLANDVLWTKTGVDTAQRGVAHTTNAFSAWKNGGEIEIANLTGGITGTAATPTSGSFKDMEMDDNAQVLFQATSTNITRTTIFPLTTMEPVGQGAPTPGPTPPPSGGLRGGAVGIGEDVCGDCDNPEEVGGWLLGVLLTFALAGIGAFLGRKFWAFLAGGALGFVGAWVFGWFTNALVFGIIIVLVLTALVIGALRARSGGP